MRQLLNEPEVFRAVKPVACSWILQGSLSHEVTTKEGYVVERNLKLGCMGNMIGPLHDTEVVNAEFRYFRMDN